MTTTNSIFKEINETIELARECQSEELFLTDYRLTELPAGIKYLRHLKSLYLFGNNFRKLPLEVCELINLEKLYFSDCNLEEIPEEIGKLTKLKIIDFKNNKLSKLPDGFAQLKELNTLNLNNNAFEVFPEQLTHLNLCRLTIQENKIQQLPDDFGKMKNLEVAYLSKNQLNSLPASLGEISNLKKLDLSSNNLTTLPESFRNLVNLDSNNQKFEWNKGLRLEGNKFEISQDLLNIEPLELINTILELNKPATIQESKTSSEKTFFRSNKKVFESVAHYHIFAFGENEWKVIEVLENFFDFNEDYSLAEIIVDGKKYTFRFTNFGFLNMEAAASSMLRKHDVIRIFTAHNSDEFQGLSIVTDAPHIFVAENNSKENSAFADALVLNKILKNPLLFESALEACTTQINSENISDELLEISSELIQFDELFLEKEKVDDFLVDYGLEKKIERVAIVKQLHKKGLIFRLKNPFPLSEHIVADKNRLYSYLKLIYNSIFIAKNRGIIEVNDFTKVFGITKSSDKLGLLLSALIQNKWVFKIEGDKLLFPYFLASKSAYNSSNFQHAFRYQFNASCVDLFYDLMAHFNAEILHELRWKDGFVVSIKNCEVLVNLNGNNEINVSVSGINSAQVRSYLNIFFDNFFKSREVIFVLNVRCNCNVCLHSETPHFYEFNQLVLRKNQGYSSVSCPLSMTDIELNSLTD